MQKKYRLKSSRVFNYLHKRGKTSANKWLVLVYAPSKYPIKVGFIVSKKVGKAVVRNKVRRRLREIFRALIPYLEQNCNYIIISRAQCTESSFSQLANAVATALLKANLIIKQIDEEAMAKLSLDRKLFEKTSL
ncbi:MAG: ribonuclease P protein component [Clostridia bacterium]|nr:ribonuclease P protein component [Clostridia bacterium]MDE7328602.1 ribonuclease P protein component [Clostridia bacterium]